MQYSNICGYHISKLTLGTVALGLDYGISNKEGKPNHKDGIEVLSAAIEGGINTLDTARSYGDAERLIGDFLMQKKEPIINIVTKFKISPDNIASEQKFKNEVYQSIRNSLKQLHLEQVPICLFHADRQLPLKRVAKILPGLLENLKMDGLIDIAGISVDHPDEADFVLQSSVIEAVQIPLNIFDLRLIKNGMIDRLKDRGKIIFARSIFLQGLFFMSPDDLKGNLIKAKRYIEQLHKLAKQADMTVAQLAFSFVRDTEGITSIVFGAVNAVQVYQNVQLLQVKTLSNELRAQVNSYFADVPEEIITPGIWTL
ncbi:MAG: aldo/keto reductase [Chitinophagaceae bacterium]|nr:MAG: aldo/keto reductase [Chitinophagaceae bacterium]